MILLNDERIMSINSSENNDPIICLRNFNENILIDETKKEIGNDSPLFCYAREEVAKKLVKAVAYLPEEYKFVIKEAYRPLSLQKSFFDDAFKYYKDQYPLKNEDEIYELTCQFVAPIKVAGHVTGGAIDITLSKNGHELDMGSCFNDTPMEPENLTYTYSKYINEEAKNNRAILINSMEKAGFINYPTEWWHWSYGDCYWAYFNKCHAIYSPVDEKDIFC